MRAGELRHRITIQAKTITQDSELNSVETWVTLATVWAAALPKDGREFYRLSTMNSEITEAFKIRYRSTVIPHMRLIHKGKTFDIIGVINTEERNREMLLTCKGVA